jgi:tRNA nucleotidyltransferase (CCA-adding enzyme)
LSPDAARRTLEGLRSSNRDTEFITHQVRQWHALGATIRASLAEVTDVLLRRWAAAIGRTHFNDFVRIATARWMADGDAFGSPIVAMYRRGTRIAFRDPLTIADLAIDGGDLMEMGIPAGPEIGSTLRRMLDTVVEDPSRNQREVLLDLVRSAR